jgi:hypothetical protein
LAAAVDCIIIDKTMEKVLALQETQTLLRSEVSYWEKVDVDLASVRVLGPFREWLL